MDSTRYLVEATGGEIYTYLLYYDKLIFPANTSVMDGWMHTADLLHSGNLSLELLYQEGLYLPFDNFVQDTDSPSDPLCQGLTEKILNWEPTIENDLLQARKISE